MDEEKIEIKESAPAPIKPPPENKEAVDETIREIVSERQKQTEKKTPVWLVILMYVFFPVTLAGLLLRSIFKKIKFPITFKLAVVYSLVFAVILVFFSFFFLSSIADKLDPASSEDFLKSLKISTTILDVVFTIVFAALVAVVSTLMLNPIRRISNKIDSITSDDLSERLEIIDTQDELMELTDRINGMLDNIEESFVRQQNFVSDASHELKTPIAVIQGYSNLLKRWGAQKPEILNEGIDSICRESENMKRIIDQLLLLARLGKMHMNKSVFNVCEALDDMVEGYRIVNTTHKIVFHGDEEIMAETDKNLLIESIRAIVDNAVKYTPPGGSIDVKCELDGECLKISVQDTGVGISSEDIDKIFDRFFRCDKARGREKGSSGLGLTIAKSIIEMMGGKISVESELGKGSKFIIELF